MKNLVLALLLFSHSTLAAVKVEVLDPVYDEYEGLQLAEKLIEHGEIDKSEELLKQMSSSEKRKSLFSRLQGDLQFKAGKLDLAESHFEEGLNKALIDNEEEVLRVRIAETQYLQKKYKACSSNLSKISSELEPKILIIYSRCLFHANLWEKAWIVLHSAEASELEKEKIQLLVRMNLQNEAEKKAFEFLSTASPSDGLQVADIFNKSESSLFRILEALRVRFPTQSDILLAWAQVAYSKGMTLQTAEAFALASVEKPQYYYHTTELFRQLGKPSRSLYYSNFIVDENESLKSKVALAVDRSEYVRIAALEGPISRSTLAKDDDINYALAFSLLKKGDRQKASMYLDRVQKAEMQSKVVSLRKVIETQSTL